ncbi:flagellar biosynthetic protein FliR [Novipirellula artificiosorum]|uniref:Flagellar biosynthetic protein FliR n=1 Tax=Novipirellula artificiosorum TaxID=2528016 RepID=A0A5C6E2K9_9BACT|nr:flagellar biosynthetic protein FliR [Novipirellula artificiosorum]TWU42207.1 Flagellar biosynthetic protein FliR [Novipirellula artificiosorum]
MQPADFQTLVQWAIDHLVLGVLVLTRLSTLLMSMPAISAGVPRRVRALLAIAMTLLLLPPVAANVAPESLPRIDNLIELAIAIAREGVIGLLIGSTIQLIVTGLQLAGEMISSTGGMQLGHSVDPTTHSSMPTLAKMIGLLVTAVMLAVGGHRIILGILVDSFEAIPAGNVVFTDSMMTLILDQLSAGMTAGVRVAAPVVAALLMSNLLTGLISRTLPQINVLAVGLSINALALLVVTTLTIGSAGLIFQDELIAAAERISRLW